MKMIKTKIKSKLLLIALSFTISSNIYSQEEIKLDEEFMKSLPPDVQEALAEEIKKDEQKLKDVDYGVFSTMIDKDRALNKFINQELLETKKYKDPQSISLEDLKIFGSDFFKDFPSTFMPVSEPALTTEYIIGIGDLVNVNTVGAFEAELEARVSRSGSLNLPSIGKVQVAGLSLEAAENLLNKVVREKFVGTDIFISVKEMRDIQVILTGFVEVPGIYTLSGNSSALAAVRAAGGIKEGGSYRNIAIKRKGKIVSTLDIYKLLIDGTIQVNSALQDGDVVHIEPLTKLVSIYGGVKRPAKYEIIDESIFDLIYFAGMSLTNSEVNQVSLTRKSDTSDPQTFKVLKNQFADTKLLPNDKINVPFRENNQDSSVLLAGEFLQYGRFSPEDARALLTSSNLKQTAYPISFIKKTFNKTSNTYTYSLENFSSDISISSNDQVFAISNSDIDFINSNDVYDFFNDSKKRNDLVLACDLFSSVAEMQNSSMFLAVTNLLDNRMHSLDNEAQKTSSVDKLLKDFTNGEVSQSDIRGKDLFKNGECISDYGVLFDLDPRLLPFLIINSVNVEGALARSGFFPISPDTPLNILTEYVNFASSPNQDNEINQMYLSNSEGTSIFSFNSSKLIQPGDSLTFPTRNLKKYSKVSISGAVSSPGQYLVSKTSKLSDLVKLANGYQPNAYTPGGILIRNSAKEIEASYHERLYNNIIQTLSGEIAQGNAIGIEGLNLILTEFKSIKPVGRVITEFNLNLLKRNPSSDIILEDMDSVHIPYRNNIVYVLGEVLTPGPQNFDSSYTVNDYIARAGGFTDYVNKGAVIKVLPNGVSQSVSITFNLFGGDDDILPGTVIYATRDIRKLDNLRLASAIAPVVSSIAISLASLNAISND